MIVLLAEGHLLVEDVPGVGKTMLAKALARAIDGGFARIQFTPDLLPSDITGVSIFNQDTRDFEFRRGAVFANVVVGDEINRASPKTQSALLEAMEERQVTVDGTTYQLPRPFLVMATQNPIEMEGTYPLPEAQRDRFMARITMGYPGRASEVAMLAHHAGGDQLASVSPVTDAATIAAAIESIRKVYVAPVINDYIVSIVEQTRQHADLRLGASPRSSLHLMRAARVQQPRRPRLRHPRGRGDAGRRGAEPPRPSHGGGPGGAPQRREHRARCRRRRPHSRPGVTLARKGTRLTGRGWALVVLGGAASTAAAWLGEPDLLWLTLALTLLPLLAMAYLDRGPSARQLCAGRDPRDRGDGESARTVLSVANESPAQASALRFRDANHESLGGGATFRHRPRLRSLAAVRRVHR